MVTRKRIATGDTLLIPEEISGKSSLYNRMGNELKDERESDRVIVTMK
jgi:hypothetical protein